MKLIQKLCFSIIFLLFLYTIPLFAYAQENNTFDISLSQNEFYPGEKIKISISCDEIQNNIGAFIVRTEFDSSALIYNKYETGSTIKSQYIQTAELENTISFVYTNKLSDNDSSLQGELFTLTFTAKTSEQALPFKVSIEQIADKNGTLTGSDISQELAYSILPAQSNDCKIIFLSPDSGELEPSFDPGITEYQINLPYETTKLNFDVETVSGASWKINRKNLGAGGSAVDFLITVTSEDKTASQVYTITANRAEKGTATSSSAKTTTSKNTQTTTQDKTTKDKNVLGGENANYVDDGNAKNAYELSAMGGLSHLVIESGGFPPFLWGVFGSFILVLIIYVIGLQLKLLIVSKEKKTEIPVNTEEPLQKLETEPEKEVVSTDDETSL